MVLKFRVDFCNDASIKPYKTICSASPTPPEAAVTVLYDVLEG